MQVDKQRFSYLLSNYRSLTDKETIELIALQKQFPYSQAIRNITTWGTYHNNLPTRKPQLYIATLYATNRKLFKTLITAPRVERKVTPRVKKTTVSQATCDLQPTISEQAKRPQLAIPTTPQMNEILNHLPDELLSLKKNRLNFEQTMKSLEDNVKPDNKSTQKAPLDAGSHLKKSTPREVVKKLITRKKTSKKILTKKMVKKKPNQKKTIKKIVKKIPKITQKKLSTAKKKTSGKAPKKTSLGKQQLVKKSSSKKVLPKKKLAKKTASKKKIVKKKLGTKKKGQQKIIENFIQSKPKGSKTNPKAIKLNDLSEMSYTLNKRAISETLVQVLIAQGKKNEAIEILKKLIWKTPQKKALFISQIKTLESLS